MRDVRDGLYGAPTESFATKATGPSPGRVMIVWEGGALSRELPPVATLVVGRSPECDLTVEHASVSRQHARLHVGARMWIEDLGSANGTRVRRRRLARGERVEVGSGEVVELGATHLVMTAPSAPPDVAPSRGRESRGAANPSIELVEGRVMRELYTSIEPVAASDLCVLLLGETGVGKERVASRIHASSGRRDGPFVAINCAALPEALLESELFGHERGAFTGAQSAKAGLFEAAAGGTVLLDELGELTVSMQSKLLRALENREIVRVGALKARPIDVRFISATSRDIDALVRAGSFRPDLFYRVSGAVVRVPPLRERVDEIGPLAELFVRVALERSGRPIPRLAPSTRALLERHPWPGNVRELRNAMERAALTCRASEITPDDVVLNALSTPSLAPPSAPAFDAPPLSNTGLRTEVEALERKRILEVLEQCGGNQTRAAKALGISRRTLLTRLDEYRVPRPRK